MPDNARSEFKKLVGQMFQIPTDEVNNNLTFKGNLGAGPDEIKQLIAMEETECGVKFADDATEKLKTVGEFCDALEALIAAKDDWAIVCFRH